MTVSELIEKLGQYPTNASVGVTLLNKGTAIQNPFGDRPNEIVLGKIYLTIEPKDFEFGYYLDLYENDQIEPLRYEIRDKERTVFVDIL